MFWATNDKPVMMLGDDAALAHKIAVKPKSKGEAECNLFEAVGGKEVCGAAEERVFVSFISNHNFVTKMKVNLLFDILVAIESSI